MTNYENGVVHLGFVGVNGGEGANQHYFATNGWHKLLYTTTQETKQFRFFVRNGVDNKYSINKHIVLIEGDHTNEDVPISAKSGINSTINPNITIISHPFIFGKGGRL